MKVKAPFVAIEERAGFGWTGYRLYDSFRLCLRARFGSDYFPEYRWPLVVKLRELYT